MDKFSKIRSSIRDVQRKIRADNLNKTPEELDMHEKFEDSPVALREVEYGRVVKIPTEIGGGASPMSELISPSSTYAHKHGSATQGTRFTYKKRKE